jgi:ABC-type uncharacterized transport system permease subunit
VVGNIALLQAGLIAFAIATIVLALGFAKRHQATPGNRIGLGFFVVGTALVSWGTFGKYNSQVWLDAAGVLLAIFVAWITLVAVFFANLRSMTAFAAPIVTLAMMLESFFSPNSLPNDSAQLDSTMLAGFHILFAMIGQSFAAAATVIAVILWLQHRALVQKNLNLAIGQAPALDKLEKWLVASLGIGFVFLTVGLITGAMYVESFLSGPTPGLSIKIVWALTIWVWYLVTLGGHRLYAWSSKKVAWMTMAGFGLLFISFFGLGFFRDLGG